MLEYSEYSYQGFGLKSSLVKNLISLVFQEFPGKLGQKLPKNPGKAGLGTQART